MPKQTKTNKGVPMFKIIFCTLTLMLTSCASDPAFWQGYAQSLNNQQYYSQPAPIQHTTYKSTTCMQLGTVLYCN